MVSSVKVCEESGCSMDAEYSLHVWCEFENSTIGADGEPEPFQDRADGWYLRCGLHKETYIVKLRLSNTNYEIHKI